MLDEIRSRWNICSLVDSVQLLRGSVKQHALVAANNRAMNAVVAEAHTASGQAADTAAALTKWYADHSAIRRLWAIEDHVELKVVVTLEPTADGDDALPVWLANNRHWQGDLRLCLRREVRLLFAGTFGESYVDLDAVTIAQIGWRDSWITP